MRRYALGEVGTSEAQRAAPEDDGKPSVPSSDPYDGPAANLDWLPDGLAVWVSAHGEVLETIFEEFAVRADWPDPVLLQRRLRASGGHPALTRVIAEMPRGIGWRVHSPSQVQLTLFGIACCRGSVETLAAYFGLLQLALERHSDPDADNRLQRSDADSLTSDALQARVLSRIVLEDCPFLGSGSSEFDSWDREIDERVVSFDGARDVSDFLAMLAAQRGLTRPRPIDAVTDIAAPTAELTLQTPRSAEQAPVQVPARLRYASAALLFVAALGGLALGISGPSLPIGAAVILACVVSFVVPLRWPALSLGGLVASVAGVSVFGAAVGIALDGGEHLPPLSTQLEGQLKHASDQGTYPAVRRVLRLHAGVSRTHVIVLRDESARPGGIRPELALPPSDELRVYDEVAGRLVLRFAFHAQNPGEVVQGPDGDAPGYSVRIVQVVDLNADGDDALLVAFDRLTNASGSLPVPALITWDRQSRRYRIDPLITETPKLKGASELVAGYTSPSYVDDQLSETKLAGFPVDAITVRNSLRGPVVVAGFAVLGDMGFSGRYEAMGWFLRLESGRLQLARCSTETKHLFVEPRTPAAPEDDLVRTVIRPNDPQGCGRP